MDRTVAMIDAVWGSTWFKPAQLHLGSANSTHKVTLTTGIDLGATPATPPLDPARTIVSNDGPADVEGEISGVLSGFFGVRKSGSGVLMLSGVNTYKGPTIITAGVLSITGASIDDAGSININGGKVSIPAATDEVVDKLFFNGIQQPAGTYGSVASSAANKSDTFFAGSGTITVNSSTSTFAQWASANGVAATSATDTDRDGVSNSLENIFGTSPSAFSPGLTQISATTTSVSLQHTLSPSVASDIAFVYEWSSDLTEWKASGEANMAGTTGTILASAPIAGVVTVTTTQTGTPASKLFTRVRANVVLPPSS
jgi:autotransporter-associated beta strand protein